LVDNKKNALLAQIRFAYKKPIVLGEYSQNETTNLEYWIDRFIDEEVSQYGFTNIVITNAPSKSCFYTLKIKASLKKVVFSRKKKRRCRPS
jgi:hypothetical protein